MRTISKFSGVMLIVIIGLLAGLIVGLVLFSHDSTNAWRICSSWSGKCGIYPYAEWEKIGDTFYHKKDASKFLRVNSWSYRIIRVHVDANGQLIQ